MKTIHALLAVTVFAAPFGHAEIISAQEMKALMDGGEALVIVDASKADTYDAGHLEGAVNINHADLYRRGKTPGLIKSPEELSDILGAKGIARNSNIVVYDGGSQRHSSRIYWILKHVGAESVKLLHRDIDDWKRAGLSLVTTSAEVSPVTFNPHPNAELLASIEQVQQLRDDSNVVLIDVRTPEEFDGTASNSEGHIPGAINVNFSDLLTDTGAFKDASELEAIATANGITPDKEVVFYCRTSVRASVSFIAFESILGYDNVKVYDGSYVEWKTDNPVVQ